MQKIIATSFIMMSLTACGSNNQGAAVTEEATPAAQTSAGEVTNEEIVELYAQNKDAIDLVWTGLLTPATTTREATLQWLGLGKPSVSAVVVEIYAQNKDAIDAVWAELGGTTTLRQATQAWIARRDTVL
jgi:hypothetical protein